MTVRLYADYVSPYCYLAEAVIESLGAEAGGVERRAFELWPAGSGDGPPLPDAAEWDIAEAIAARLAVPLHRPAVRPRTRKAHEAAAYARERGRFRDMHAAIYGAYHTEGRDIGRVDVLSELAGAIGLDALDLRIALDIDRYADAVAAEQRAAQAAGVVEVPVLARDDAILRGLQPAAVVRAFLHGAPVNEDEGTGVR